VIITITDHSPPPRGLSLGFTITIRVFLISVKVITLHREFLLGHHLHFTTSTPRGTPPSVHNSPSGYLNISANMVLILRICVGNHSEQIANSPSPITSPPPRGLPLGFIIHHQGILISVNVVLNFAYLCRKRNIREHHHHRSLSTPPEGFPSGSQSPSGYF
jgi:hypothetical protein